MIQDTMRPRSFVASSVFREQDKLPDQILRLPFLGQQLLEIAALATARRKILMTYRSQPVEFSPSVRLNVLSEHSETS